MFGFPEIVAMILSVVGAPPEGPAPASIDETVTEAAPAIAVEPKLEVIASSPLPASFHPGSGFGYRASPRTGRRTFHAGVDFLAPRGTPVYAVRPGIVEAVARNVRGSRVLYSGYGNAVVVYHPDVDQWSFYAHLSEASVEVGQEVWPGQRIGAVGNTTNGRFPRMGAHLHFEVRHRAPDGTCPFPGAYRQHNVDPESWLAQYGIEYPDPTIALDAVDELALAIEAERVVTPSDPNAPLLAMRVVLGEEVSPIERVVAFPPSAAAVEGALTAKH